MSTRILQVALFFVLFPTPLSLPMSAAIDFPIRPSSSLALFRRYTASLRLIRVCFARIFFTPLCTALFSSVYIFLRVRSAGSREPERVAAAWGHARTLTRPTRRPVERQTPTRLAADCNGRGCDATMDHVRLGVDSGTSLHSLLAINLHVLAYFRLNEKLNRNHAR